MSVTHAAITRIAEPRGNLITKRQLQEELGLSDRSIYHFVKMGVLLPLTRDVYSVGHADPPMLQYMRAACITWPGVALGESTAAGLWGLRRARRDAFELVIPKGLKVDVPYARIRRSTHLPETDLVEHLDGLRVTTPARTLFDMAATLDPFALRSMAEDALNKELCTMAALREVAARLRGRGRKGADLFTRYLDDRPDDQAPVMSELELRLGDALRAAGLPVEQQRRLTLPTGRVVFLDLAIERSRLDIEIDHHEWHAGLVEVQRDKTRDVQVSCKKWHPLRYTDRDIEQRLSWVVSTVTEVDRWRCELAPSG